VPGVAIAVAGLPSAPSARASAHLDLSLGEQGVVDLAADLEPGAWLGAMAVAPDGGVFFTEERPACPRGGCPYLVGLKRYRSNGSLDRRFAGFSLARFLADGRPDVLLAGSGRLFFPTPGAEGSVVAATQTRNGRVIVAFEESTEHVSTVDNVARIAPSGALAPHFGRKGRLRLFPRVGSSGVSALAVDAKGRLVGTGWSGRVNVFRLRSDGGRDRTFNGGQSVHVPYGTGGITDYSIAVQSSGRIVVLAEVGCCGERQGFALIGVRGGTSHTRCLKHKATIVGTRGRDELIGTPHRDVIAALGGKDKVRGLGGPDIICGGKGRDTLLGGPGRDTVRQ
jgi:Ca2+-binding RTX toxin-like protein